MAVYNDHQTEDEYVSAKKSRLPAADWEARAEKAGEELAASLAEVRRMISLDAEIDEKTDRALKDRFIAEAELATLRAKAEKLAGMMREFASQKLSHEIPDTDCWGTEFDDAYDLFVTRSRAALAEWEGKP